MLMIGVWWLQTINFVMPAGQEFTIKYVLSCIVFNSETLSQSVKERLLWGKETTNYRTLNILSKGYIAMFAVMQWSIWFYYVWSMAYMKHGPWIMHVENHGAPGLFGHRCYLELTLKCPGKNLTGFEYIIYKWIADSLFKYSDWEELMKCFQNQGIVK